MFYPPHTIAHTLKNISISFLVLLCIQYNLNPNIYHQKIARNIFILVTSTNWTLLLALLRAGAPQLRRSQGLQKKQVPTNPVLFAWHEELEQESIALSPDPSEHFATRLSIFDPPNSWKRSPVGFSNIYVMTIPSTHNVTAYSLYQPVSDHPLHQVFSMARLILSNEVDFYHLTTPSVQLNLLKSLHLLPHPPPAPNIVQLTMSTHQATRREHGCQQKKSSGGGMCSTTNS
jgi:hypothetical protein